MVKSGLWSLVSLTQSDASHPNYSLDLLDMLYCFAKFWISLSIEYVHLDMCTVVNKFVYIYPKVDEDMKKWHDYISLLCFCS